MVDKPISIVAVTKRGESIVIIDTNCLLYSVENKIDLLESISKSMEGRYQAIVPSSVISELMSMAGKKGNRATTAAVAISIFSKREIRVIKTDMKADEWIIETVRELKEKGAKCAVCTYDRDLKKNLKELGAVIIVLKR